MSAPGDDGRWRNASIVVQCACGARFQSVPGHPLVRCAVCSAVTDLRTLNAPAPPQSAPAPSEPKSKARVEVAPEVNLDDTSSEEEAPKEKPRVEARDEEPIQLKPIVPPKVVEPVDPEYASDDEAVKGKYRRKVKARDVLLVLLLVALAIGTIVGVVVLGVQLSKSSGGSKNQPTLAVIVAAILVVAAAAGFGIQEWRFRRISHLTIVTEMWSAVGYIFIQGAGFLFPFYLNLKQAYPKDSDHWWSIVVETVICVILTVCYYLYLRFRLPRLPFYRHMSPPGTFVSWFVIVFAPQVIVWVGVGLWHRQVSSHHAAIFACSGVLWAVSIFFAAASNRGLLLTAACAASSVTAIAWNFSAPEALCAWIFIFVACAFLALWPHASRPWMYTVSAVMLVASVFFVVLNQFKRPNVDDNSMPIFGRNSPLRAQDALFIAILFWIPAYIRDRDFLLPFVISVVVVFTSPVWATAFWSVTVVVIALWALFTRTMPWYYTRLLFVTLLGAWYAWGWLCDWDTSRDRGTVLGIAYALLVVGCILDLRAFDVLPLSALKSLRSAFRPKPTAHTYIGYVILEVPKHLLDTLHPLTDVVVQVDHNTTDGIGGWLKDLPHKARVSLRVFSLVDRKLRTVEVTESSFLNIKARSDYLGSICDSFCKVNAVTEGSPAAQAGVERGQILFGPFTSDRELRRALFGRRGFRIATYATSDPPTTFSKKRIPVPTKKGQEIREDPFPVIGLSLAPANCWSLPEKLDLDEEAKAVPDADKPYRPDSAVSSFFINSNNAALGNWTFVWWVIATAVSVLAFKDNYRVFTFVLAISYLLLGAVQAVWMRLVNQPRAWDVRSVAIVLTFISAAYLWFIVGYRANPFTHGSAHHHLNIELWVIVSVFVATAYASGWFQRAEKAFELRGLWSGWRAEKQQAAAAAEGSTEANRVFSLILWCGVPFLLYAALLAVWPAPSGFELTRWTPVLLLLVPCAFTLAVPLLPYVESAGKVAVTQAFMLVLVALVPRILIGVGDDYGQTSQNWRARLAYDLILAATAVLMIPLQLVRSNQPHPALIAAFCCIGMLTSFFSILLIVVLVVLSGLVIVLGAGNEDSYMWAVFWVVPITGAIRSLEFLVWNDGAHWKFVWIGVIGIFLLVWCFTTYLLQAFTSMYKKEHVTSAVGRCVLACGAAFLLLQWSHGIGTVVLLGVVGVVYLVLPKNKMAFVWIILPPLFFPAVWAVFDWEGDRWHQAAIPPAGVALLIAALSSPMLSGLNPLRNSVKKHGITSYWVHELSCVIAIAFGLLTWLPTKGGLGLAIVAIVLIHAMLVRHLWWHYFGPLLVGLAVYLITVGIDKPSSIAAGIAGAVYAGLLLVAGIALYRLHHWFLFSRDRTEDERKAKRHASGRWNFAIAFDETTFTISLELFAIAYLVVGVFLALHHVPLIGCAVISGSLMLVLLAKFFGGAQTWPSLPSELYWLVIAAFAIASAFTEDTHGVMPIVVASFFAVACMLAGYRWWILCYPGLTALFGAFAALSIQGSEACVIGAGWGAVIGALLCMLARALASLHHFRFKRGEKDVWIAESASDAAIFHKQWTVKRNFYIALEVTAAVWYLVAGVPLYLGAGETNFGHRVAYAIILLLIGAAHTVGGFMRGQKWRKYGGLALLVIACLYGAFIKNEKGFKFGFFIVMAVVIVFMLSLFVYPIIKNWCRNVPDEDIEMGHTNYGIPQLEKEHQLVPEPAGSPAAQPVAPTQAAQDNHESLLIPTGIILPDGPEHAKASDAIDGSQKLLVGDAGAAEAGERDRTEERRRQKKDRKGKRARKEGVPLSDDEPPIPTEPSPALPVVPEDNEHNDAHASDQQPLLAPVDNAQFQAMQKRMQEMEQRLLRSEQEQRTLKDLVDRIITGRVAVAAPAPAPTQRAAPTVATASAVQSIPTGKAVPPAWPPSAAPVPAAREQVFEKQYAPKEPPVRFTADRAVTTATCPYRGCQKNFECAYLKTRDSFEPLRCPHCNERVSAPVRLVSARTDLRHGKLEKLQN